MSTIDCHIANQIYQIHIGVGLLKQRNLFEPWRDRALMFVVDKRVPASFYEFLHALPNRAYWHYVNVGEPDKNLSSVEVIWQTLIEQGFDRHSVLISIGGGVLSDMVGFCASCYMRGIPWINIPTTLMAQVDAGLGGKTGVNFHQLKNVIGMFHHPQAVYSDPLVLDSLSERDYCSGLAEVVKYAIAFDENFLAWLEQHRAQILERKHAVIESMIHRCSLMKTRVVEQDTFDLGVRHSLNLGHTFAHALESSTQFSLYTHGEAVSIGIMLALQLGKICGEISLRDINRVSNLLTFFRLPVCHPGLTSMSLKPYLYKDKKKQGEQLCFVVPKLLGKVEIVRNLEETLLDTVINTYA